MKRRLIVTIDGPAGSGKSTTARAVSHRLDYVFLDSGALYRAVTLAAIRAGVDTKDEKRVASIARACSIEMTRTAEGDNRIFLDQEDVTGAIRQPEITNAIAPVAAHKQVRQTLVSKQRALATDGGIVAEGRDMGTVVFPDADLKIYMHASLEERARRRLLELEGKGIQTSLQSLMNDIAQRDRSDTERAFGPLRQPDDAIVVDTSTMMFEEQVSLIVSKTRERGG